MATPDNLVVIYKELADAHERQLRPQLRDRYLVLAADAALTAGRKVEADLLLARLLRSNPHHMLRPYTSFAQAMAAADVQNYVGDLRREHPPEQAEAEFDALRAARTAPPARQTGALPPTAPVLELDDAPAANSEPLKVYRTQDDAGARPPRAPGPPPPAAAPKFPPRPGRTAPRAADEFPLPTLPGDPDEAGRGAWVSLGLFVLTLAAAAALAAWALLRPFLPHG
jgi:hypothetical protein